MLAGCSPQPPQTMPSAPTSNPVPSTNQVAPVPGDLLRQDKLAAESSKDADGDLLAAEQVAIENGSTLWIDLYAQRVVAKGRADRCRRALYWMRRAIRTGRNDAEYVRSAMKEGRLGGFTTWRGVADTPLRDLIKHFSPTTYFHRSANSGCVSRQRRNVRRISGGVGNGVSVAAAQWNWRSSAAECLWTG